MKMRLCILFALVSVSVSYAETAKNPVAQKKAEKVGSIDDGHKAQVALEELLRAYGTGNTSYMRDHLDPHMIGFQRLLDNSASESNSCKQMQIRLLDTQVQAGPDLVVIQTGWEKRCLQMPNFTPKLDSGQSTFLMHKAAGGWNMTAVSGTSPLTPISTTCTGRGC